MNFERLRWRYWMDIFRRRQMDTELDEEIKSHIALETRSRIDEGEFEDAARNAAMREVRSVALVKEATREVRAWGSLDRLTQDLRYAVRVMRKSPLFSILAIVVMGLGIGCSTAVFSLIDAVFFKPLGFQNADRLVMLWERTPRFGVQRMEASASDYLDWKEQSSAFEDLAGYYGNAFNLTGEGEPERLDGIQATPNLFPLLGVQPKLGRWFSSEEGLPGQAQVAILSYGFWKRRFGGRPGLVGETIRIDDKPFQVVGVMPEGFQFPRAEIQLWIPTQFPRTESGPAGRSVHFLNVVGRLKPDVALKQAATEIQAIAQNLSKLYPMTNKDYSASVVPLRQDFVRNVRTSLFLLLMAGLLVLVIACANVANMLVTRGIGRRHEVAVRAALGATRGRIARQLIVEGTLLAACGSTAGVAIAVSAFRFLGRLVPPELAGAVYPALDIRMLTFAVIASLLTGIAFGLAPLREVCRFDLKHAFTGRTMSSGHGRTRALLVSLEMALAVVVVISTGLIIRTILNIGEVNPGFRSDHVLTMRLELSPARYATTESRIEYYRTILESIRSIPGVVSAGFTTFLPYTNFGGTSGLFVQGHPELKPTMVYRREVSPEYMQTLGVPLLKGRWFNEQDDTTHPPVVIITETAAKQFNGDAVGQHIRLGAVDGPWSTIVGVVGDIREESLQLPSQRATGYTPLAQTSSVWFFNPRDLAIRVGGEPMNMVDTVKHEIWSINPNQTISQIRSLETIIEMQIADRKLQGELLSLFSTVAIFLAALGIYALLSFAVESQTKEFGIRMALGANRWDLVTSVFRESVISIFAGTIMGLVLGLVAARSFASLLYSVTPSDPLTIIGAVSLLFGVGGIAAAIPAWRATRIDPMVALRHD